VDSTAVRLHTLELGGGTVEVRPGLFRLATPATTSGYTDAQLDDTAGRPRANFLHRPPFRMSLRARASHASPHGTLGFGLWNDPFGFSLGLGGTTRRFPASPQAVWFFYGSPPNDMAFARPGVAVGWKAASLRSPSAPAAVVAAGGAAVVALSPWRRLQAAVVSAALSWVQASEVRLAIGLDDWHHYSLAWTDAGASFGVDGQTVLHTTITPSPPLGFVAWIDNQFAVVSPTGGLRFGVLPVEQPQWLEVADLDLESGPSTDNLRPGPR
jgi:hypothetical protein